jgi:hypothetical protein
MKELSPQARELLAQYREETEVSDMPEPAVLAGIEASLCEAPTLQPRRAAAWVWVVGASAAAAVATAVVWPRLTRPKPEPEPSAVVAPDHAPERPASAAERRAVSPAVLPQEPPVEPSPAPSVKPSVESSATELPRKAPAAPTPAPAADALKQELMQLEKARAALRAQRPKQAIAALTAHARAHPHGQLAEERDALLVVARCTAAQPNTGRAAFEARHPRSHHLAAIRSACDEEKAPAR